MSQEQQTIPETETELSTASDNLLMAKHALIKARENYNTAESILATLMIKAKKESLSHSGTVIYVRRGHYSASKIVIKNI